MRLKFFVALFISLVLLVTFASALLYWNGYWVWPPASMFKANTPVFEPSFGNVYPILGLDRKLQDSDGNFHITNTETFCYSGKCLPGAVIWSKYDSAGNLIATKRLFPYPDGARIDASIGDEQVEFPRYIGVTRVTPNDHVKSLYHYSAANYIRVYSLDKNGNLLNYADLPSSTYTSDMEVDSQANTHVLYHHTYGSTVLDYAKINDLGNILKRYTLDTAYYRFDLTVDDADNVHVVYTKTSYTDSPIYYKKINTNGDVVMTKTIITGDQPTIMNFRGDLYLFIIKANQYQYLRMNTDGNILEGPAILPLDGYWTQGNAFPSLDNTKLYYIQLQADMSGQNYCETAVPCACSATACRIPYNGQKCDGCNYVAAPPEVCDNGLDDDCDGVVDDGCCTCTGSSCNPAFDGTKCDGCNYVSAGAEVCTQFLDMDCDGLNAGLDPDCNCDSHFSVYQDLDNDKYGNATVIGDVCVRFS
ncbi:hypothetical protein KY330_02780 [Candidatus Woesearchaeota archaeon]|nr:hypothetical protein [Candidatus Woesearchaeota archaeon]